MTLRSWLNFFRRNKAPEGTQPLQLWWVAIQPDGVSFQPTELADSTCLQGVDLDGLLCQLVDDGYAEETAHGCFLSWDGFYAMERHAGYAGAREALGLPAATPLRPSLVSRGSLTDHDFAIVLGPWSTPSGSQEDVQLTGAMLQSSHSSGLLSHEQWQLVQSVRAFARRGEAEHDGRQHRLAWGRIRREARAANAKLSDFLHRSVVLTPEKLSIDMRKSVHVTDDSVVEVIPGFEEAPSDWLVAFDKSGSVLGQYDLPTEEGVVQVLIEPKVRTVLEEIKRMPGRLMAGSRAQAFVVNPYATLGPDAAAVIDEQQFEQARVDAGLVYERFTPLVERNSRDQLERVGLLIEMVGSHGPTGQPRWLSHEELSQFINKVERSLARLYQLVSWQGHDFEVSPDTAAHLECLKSVLGEIARTTLLVSQDKVYDLSRYSARINGIGIEQPLYSPYIAKLRDNEGWFPDNVQPYISYQDDKTGEMVIVPADKPTLDAIRQAMERAERDGEVTITLPGIALPMPVTEAASILQTLGDVQKDIERGKFNPSQSPEAMRVTRPQSKRLLLADNVEVLGYSEGETQSRSAILLNYDRKPQMPSGIQAGYAMLPHQEEGLAWLQHLHRQREIGIAHGALLADDMGLGKTFQLLAYMAWYFENHPEAPPALVVAPVSLLENWQEEAGKFFLPGCLPMLTAYGDGLEALRVPNSLIDERLRNQDGLVKFLRPGWIGSARIVLTTYETIRDLEFAFAAEGWSIMVCDEAQRIKNPAAMVTRSVKKQNAWFKVACTGTPVENTLVDLWCLFDYFQPGLLGALNEFGDLYRKPIEGRDEGAGLKQLEALRTCVMPQILRRTKAEVAKLPPKIVVEDCQRLPLSDYQRQLYSMAVQRFRHHQNTGEPSPFKNHLGLLHYLRLVCSDPHLPGLGAFKPEPLAEYRNKAPKLDWLLETLTDIRAKGEKVIVFCEFREIQRLLQYYIHEATGYKPDIINGDTKASAKAVDSRQKRIKAFQSLPDFGVIILSPVAVGFGVNIQKANHVVHYTRTWNPAKEDQATDRAYRIGQERVVYVYYPSVWTAEFDTFDTRLDKLLNAKRSLADDILQGARDVQPADFKLADIVPPSSSIGWNDRVVLDMALRMEPDYFEGLVCVLWGKQGYISYRTPSAGDNGVDVVAIASKRGQLVQAKSSVRDNAALGWDAVAEVLGGHAYYQRRHPGIDFSKVCITNQYFNGQAHDNARLSHVELIEQPQLAELLDRHRITMLEVEQAIYADWNGGGFQ